MSVTTISAENCFVGGTNARKGRTQWLAPGSFGLEELHYGRIILDADTAPVRFLNHENETGLICLQGQAKIICGRSTFRLSLYDSLYVPRDSDIEIIPGDDGVDLAELSAPVENAYPLQFIPYSQVVADPGLHFKTGTTSFERTVNILIGKNVEAGRILAGVTFSQPGNWTSWPPHEHAEILEEAYIYIAMPAPAWGVQFVYTNSSTPELTQVVREGDCVVIPKGYHPNVAAPGGPINFLWIMAAHREVEDRQFGIVNVQPEYAGGGTGLESGQAKTTEIKSRT